MTAGDMLMRMIRGEVFGGMFRRLPRQSISLSFITDVIMRKYLRKRWPGGMSCGLETGRLRKSSRFLCMHRKGEAADIIRRNFWQTVWGKN